MRIMPSALLGPLLVFALRTPVHVNQGMERPLSSAPYDCMGSGEVLA